MLLASACAMLLISGTGADDLDRWQWRRLPDLPCAMGVGGAFADCFLVMESRNLQRAACVAVALLWFVALLNYLDRQFIVTMGQPIKGDANIGDAYFGLFSSWYFFGSMRCAVLLPAS